MNNYCKHLKKRNNKPYCLYIKKEISLSLCYECANKEYKIKNAQYSKNIVQKSKQLSKLERNRFSVFTKDLEHCYLCGRKKEELHEIFAGRNRKNSMKYGFVLPLCHKCHSYIQNNVHFSHVWYKKGELYWINNIGSKNEFIRVFGKNYLD